MLKSKSQDKTSMTTNQLKKLIKEKNPNTRLLIIYKDQTIDIFRTCYIQNKQIFVHNQNSAKGWQFKDMKNVSDAKIIKENLPTSEFKTYNEFARKFDNRFIAEETISELYNQRREDGSARYQKEDFKQLQGKGLIAMKKFLSKFSQRDKVNQHYEKGILKIIIAAPDSRGKDIIISHKKGQSFITYDSNFFKRNSGDYYIVANSKKLLFIEQN